LDAEALLVFVFCAIESKLIPESASNKKIFLMCFVLGDEVSDLPLSKS
jgi:hypothetical protein